MEYQIGAKTVQATAGVSEHIAALCDAAKIADTLQMLCCYEPTPVYIKVGRIARSLNAQIEKLLS